MSEAFSSSPDEDAATNGPSSSRPDERASLERLAGSHYAVGAYMAASDHWERFRETASTDALREATATLHPALAALAYDDDFFGTLESMARLKPQREDPFGYFEVDTLLAYEVPVLVTAGMTPAHAVRLATDLSGLLEGRTRIEPHQPGDAKAMQSQLQDFAVSIEQTHQNLVGLAYDPAKEARAGRPPHRRWVPSLRKVGKALGVVAGAATIGANAAAAIASLSVASALALSSVYGGVEAMKKSLES